MYRINMGDGKREILFRLSGRLFALIMLTHTDMLITVILKPI